MPPCVLRIDQGRIAADEIGKPAVFGTILSGDPREFTATCMTATMAALPAASGNARRESSP